MFKITLSEQTGKLVFTLVGDLDNAASTEAARGFEPVFERTDCNVLIDCTELNYISSSGLRILLNIYKHARSSNHVVTLKGLSNDVREVFVLGGFLQLFLTED
ncbi:MAG: STAS domain-containing protein [Prevotella sp.]|nr:STAS domain-containing protein [Prevotella sp.]